MPRRLQRLSSPKPIALAVLGLLACTQADTGDSGDSGDTTTDTNIQLDATVNSLIPTVVHVSWTSQAPSTGRVEYGLPGQLEWSTADDDAPATQHDALLLGLQPATTYAYRVVADVDGRAVSSGDGEVTTGPLPAEAPPLDLSPGSAPADGQGFLTFTTADMPSDSSWIWVLDGEQQPVWMFPIQGYSTRARLSPFGAAMTYEVHSEASGPAWESTLHRVSLDGSEQLVLDAGGAADDFAEVDASTYAVLQGYQPDLEGLTEPVLSARLLEIAHDGTSTVIWDAPDTFELDPSNPSQMYRDGIHANFLHYDPDTDSYLFTLRSIPAIVKIDRSTGDVVWVLDSTGGDFTTDTSPLMGGVHSVQPSDTGLVIFDQESPLLAGCSGAAGFSLDSSSMTVSVDWTLAPDACTSTVMGGSALLLPGGNRLVDYGTAGFLDEVTPEGENCWRLSVPLGQTMGYPEHSATLVTQAP